jgi:hypothetical protein
MAMRILTRDDVEDLANRLLLRGRSRALYQHPDLQTDFRIASALLHYMLGLGIPASSIELDVPSLDGAETTPNRRDID